jgi:hypothetical protein
VGTIRGRWRGCGEVKRAFPLLLDEAEVRGYLGLELPASRDGWVGSGRCRLHLVGQAGGLCLRALRELMAVLTA